MQTLGNIFSGVIKDKRPSAEYERHALQCPVCRPDNPACPRCHGAGLLSKRSGVGKFDYAPCECRTVHLRHAQEVYSGLGLRPPVQRFQTFTATLETDEAFNKAREFAEKRTSHSIFTIQGSVGTGKTHLLQAIGWTSLEAGRQPKFISVARYLERLRSSYSDDSPVSFEALYRPLEAAQMLLLDDIGAERMTNWAQEQLYKIVNHRYQERLPMAVSMNLDEKRAIDQYGERTADRLFDTNSGRVRVVSTGTQSYRTGR